jgi:hypothetical protein
VRHVSCLLLQGSADKLGRAVDAALHLVDEKGGIIEHIETSHSHRIAPLNQLRDYEVGMKWHIAALS